MLTLYTSPSCTSCRKARAWLQEHEIPFKERNIFSEPLNIEELKAILIMTEDGTEEIISTRSKVFQKLNMDLDELPLQDLLEFCNEYGGIAIYFPSKKTLLRNGRNREMIKRYNGKNIKDLARAFEISEVQVRNIIKDSLSFNDVSVN